MTPEEIDALSSAVAKKVAMEIGTFVWVIAIAIGLMAALDHFLNL